MYNATKLLPLTNQAKVTLTVALTLTDAVTIIFVVHILLTPIKRLYHINKRNFSRRCVAGFVGGPIFCTTQQITVTCLSVFPHAKMRLIHLYTVFQKKTSTRIIGYKLRNSYLISIIFDIKIPHII